MYRSILIFLLTIILSSMSFAGDEAGMAFLKLPVDARSAAMGEAATALTSDAAAVYWNPALLALSRSRSLVFMHNAYLADIAQEFAAFQLFKGKHNLALSLNLMNIPGIEIRGNKPSEQPAGTTEAINLAAGLSYARQIRGGWTFGLTAKYLYEKYYLQDATGWAVDFGVLKKGFLTSKLDWGLVLQNAGKMRKLNEESTRLPLILRSGIYYQTPWNLSLTSLPVSATFDFVYLISEEVTNLNAGLEVPVIQTFTLRSGLIYDWDNVRFSLGFGLNYRQYQLNYAFSPYPYNLGNSHRFSLSWWF